MKTLTDKQVSQILAHLMELYRLYSAKARITRDGVERDLLIDKLTAIDSLSLSLQNSKK